MNLYEILVPTKYGDTQKPISTKHHKEWDKRVRTLTGGLTILTPAKGQFVYENSLLKERIIPVRIMCEESIMQQIVQLTIKHYRQKAVMFFLLSEGAYITYAKGTSG